jgi:hypothetical protein
MSAPIDQLSVVWVNMTNDDTDWDQIRVLLNKSKIGKRNNLNSSEV